MRRVAPVPFYGRRCGGVLAASPLACRMPLITASFACGPDKKPGRKVPALFVYSGNGRRTVSTMVFKGDESVRRRRHRLNNPCLYSSPRKPHGDLRLFFVAGAWHRRLGYGTINNIGKTGTRPDRTRAAGDDRQEGPEERQSLPPRPDGEDKENRT